MRKGTLVCVVLGMFIAYLGIMFGLADKLYFAIVPVGVLFAVFMPMVLGKLMKQKNSDGAAQDTSTEAPEPNESDIHTKAAALKAELQGHMENPVDTVDATTKLAALKARASGHTVSQGTVSHAVDMSQLTVVGGVTRDQVVSMNPVDRIVQELVKMNAGNDVISDMVSQVEAENNVEKKTATDELEAEAAAELTQSDEGQQFADIPVPNKPGKLLGKLKKSVGTELSPVEKKLRDMKRFAEMKLDKEEGQSADAHSKDMLDELHDKHPGDVTRSTKSDVAVKEINEDATVGNPSDFSFKKVGIDQIDKNAQDDEPRFLRKNEFLEISEEDEYKRMHSIMKRLGVDEYSIGNVLSVAYDGRVPTKVQHGHDHSDPRTLHPRFHEDAHPGEEHLWKDYVLRNHGQIDDDELDKFEREDDRYDKEALGGVNVKIAGRLNKLSQLYKLGLLSSEEYRAERSMIIGSLHD